MQEGYLKLSVLKILSQQQRSGYNLMKEIEQHMGRKPSSGSMYPLLKTLQREKLIGANIQGRSTVYSLTPQGKQHLKELMSHRLEFLQQMQNNLRFMEDICGERQPGIQRMFARMLKGKMPFGPFTHDLIVLRDTVLAAAEQSLTKHQETRILNMITKTTKEIKTVCRKS